MGNRAIIVFEGEEKFVYVHWNGGMDSIAPLVDYCKVSAGIGSTKAEKFLIVAQNTFGVGELDNVTENTIKNGCEDNGVYVVSRDWRITDRIHAPEQEQNYYSYEEVMKHINDSQPKRMQLPEEFLFAKELPSSMLEAGDKILRYRGYEDSVSTVEVVGKTEEGIPYIDVIGKAVNKPAFTFPGNLLKDEVMVPRDEWVKIVDREVNNLLDIVKAKAGR